MNKSGKSNENCRYESSVPLNIAMSLRRWCDGKRGAAKVRAPTLQIVKCDFLLQIESNGLCT